MQQQQRIGQLFSSTAEERYQLFLETYPHLQNRLSHVQIASIQLVVDGVADPKIVDKTWMISTGAPFGPFAFLDIIGPNTPYNLYKAYGERGDELSARVARWIKSEYLDNGKMGKANGKGVYTYPNPEFEDPNFLKGETEKEHQYSEAL